MNQRMWFQIDRCGVNIYRSASLGRARQLLQRALLVCDIVAFALVPHFDVRGSALWELGTIRQPAEGLLLSSCNGVAKLVQSLNISAARKGPDGDESWGHWCTRRASWGRRECSLVMAFYRASAELSMTAAVVTQACACWRTVQFNIESRTMPWVLAQCSVQQGAADYSAGLATLLPIGNCPGCWMRPHNHVRMSSRGSRFPVMVCCFPRDEAWLTLSLSILM
jgi:hypothetical protein